MERRSVVFEIRKECFLCFGRTSHDGIDQSASGAAGTVDGFICSGVLWDAENEELAQADAKDVACFVIEVAFAELADPVIE